MPNPVFEFHENSFEVLLNAIKFRLYNYFTRHASPLFLKGGDCISTPPIMAASYEKEIVALIKELAVIGCSDALIDIGANIGLTTFYAGADFRHVFCFEPNPKVFCVLKANLYERQSRGTELFNFALGERDEVSTLAIPKGNYGGAFINGKGNAYSLDELAGKDGFRSYDPANYDELQIEVRKGREVMAEVFAECQGGIVIKIDAEGFEQTILKEIAVAKPRHPVAIIFENWSKTFDAKDFVQRHFGSGMQAYRLCSTVEARSGKIRKLVSLLFRGRRYSLTTSPQYWTGTILLANKSIEIR